MNNMLEIYGPIMKLLSERLEMKHEEYGTSYLSRDFKWLHRRMMGEVDKLSIELFSPYLNDGGIIKSSGDIIKEALDVAICALLIADKKRREERMVFTLLSVEDPAPF